MTSVVDDIRGLAVDIRWRGERNGAPMHTPSNDRRARDVRPVVGPLAGCAVEATVSRSLDHRIGWCGGLAVEPPAGVGRVDVILSRRGRPWPTAQACQHAVAMLLLGKPGKRMMWRPAHAPEMDLWHAMTTLGKLVAAESSPAYPRKGIWRLQGQCR